MEIHYPSPKFNKNIKFSLPGKILDQEIEKRYESKFNSAIKSISAYIRGGKKYKE